MTSGISNKLYEYLSLFTLNDLKRAVSNFKYNLIGAHLEMKVFLIIQHRPCIKRAKTTACKCVDIEYLTHISELC